MDQPPAPKKRKVENEDEWGDEFDELEFTQKDLENIDIMSSQSVNNNTMSLHNPPANNPGPSGAAMPISNVPNYSATGRQAARSQSSGRPAERSQTSFTRPYPKNVSSSGSSSESHRPASSASGSRHSSNSGLFRFF